MNQFYFKLLFRLIILPGFIFLHSGTSAQVKTTYKRDRVDLLANVHKVQAGHSRVAVLKAKIKESKKVDNQKAVKTQVKKLTQEKKVLKKDYSHARDEECTYFENKKEKIRSLKNELELSEEKYSLIRKKMKKDLAKRNDFALQKDASDLLKAVQEMNETSSELSMEKSDLVSTTKALNSEWKKARSSRGQLPGHLNPADENNLSTVK